MSQLRPVEVRVPVQNISRFEHLVDPSDYARQLEAVSGAASRLAGRVSWHVNSTARGGGVAEMMGPLIGCARGAGVDARWLVIAGVPEFFRVTKRLHNVLHGDPGDGAELGPRERRTYEDVLAADAVELEALVRPGDVVFLHDPQRAGLVPALRRAGALVVWRCHIGHEHPDDPRVRRGWDFLAPYVRKAHATVFSRAAYIPACCDAGRARVIQPSIDPFSAKNQDMPGDVVCAILVHVGLLEGPAGPGAPAFQRDDGSPGQVDRGVDITRVGRGPAWETPLVVQVSRWDRLKDPVASWRASPASRPARAGAPSWCWPARPSAAWPTTRTAPAVLAEVTTAWRALPHERRRRVQIAALPMSDVHENAAIVNALQRHATVVVQKSLCEGFGLTVTEAMWKGRPVVASAVGGIVDQIEDGREGILLDDPRDLDAFAVALRRVLGDEAEAGRLGAAARERVRHDFLGMRQLADDAELIEDLTA